LKSVALSQCFALVLHELDAVYEHTSDKSAIAMESTFDADILNPRTWPAAEQTHGLLTGVYIAVKPIAYSDLSESAALAPDGVSLLFRAYRLFELRFESEQH
jgi:hypothetical protein